MLQNYAEKEPERIHLYLQDEMGHEKIIRYGELYEKSKKTAEGLQHLGLRQYETVAIMLPTCEDFFYAFFGVLLAGGLPVPIYPPFRADKIEEYAKREAKILQNAEVRILISFLRVNLLNKILKNFIPSLKAVTTVTELMALSHPFYSHQTSGTDSALIQYTSGSTGDPKGVLLTHHNLLANIRAIGQAIAIKPTDVVVSWLPLYHDMGLIGAWLGSLYFGIPITILSPISFLNHPERWLWTIHYHRATLSAGPNFAYEVCTSKIENQAIEGLDLSTWRLAFNGAEAIYPKTLTNFLKRFEKYGLRETVLYPVYGLAESSVALSFPPLDRAVRIDKISRLEFNENQVAKPINLNEKNYLEFVSCGQPLPNHEIQFINDKGDKVDERVIGNLIFKGPSAMQGYYRNAKATHQVACGDWWHSGDLGYQAEGEIFITGRKKDLIVKAGRNLYPQEIEEITAQVKGIRKGCVAAFGVINPKQGTEQLIVVAETKETRSIPLQTLTAEIREAIIHAIGEPPDKILLTPPKSIPKTSSGKLQRSSTKALYLQGKLQKKQPPTWLQLSKLWLLGCLKQGNRLLLQVFSVIFTVYAYLISFFIFLPPLVALPFSSQKSARKIIKFCARSFFMLIGCPIRVKGGTFLQHQESQIYVSNHTSYLDVLVLISILPLDVLFIAKKELSHIPILRSVMTKLGCLFIDRVDFSESLADTEILLKKLQAGQSLMIFPEGTFSYATGLRPFKLGAFKIATDTAAPICPIALKGPRIIMRSGQWLLKSHPISVWIGRPISPRDKDWREANRLRMMIRLEIAKHCGENLLDTASASPQDVQPCAK